jgi:hypothetical protein
MSTSRNHLGASTSHPMSGAGRVSTKRSNYSSGCAALDWAMEQWHVADSSRSAGRGRGSGSTKNKATCILDDSRRGSCGDISPRTKRSFVERRYSPLTDMDRSEWEIISQELMIMGYIVKEEVVSDTDD